MKRYNVMLVDDEYMILEGLKYLVDWEQLGFEIVFSTKSAQKAIEAFEHYAIDLLITDITMPEMTGLEMIEQLKEQGFSFKTLILSGYQEFAFVKKSLGLGVENYLVKPVDKVELSQNLKEIAKELAIKDEEANQEEIVKNNLLLNLLNDELNETEFQSLISLYGTINTFSFTPIEFLGPVVLLKQLTAYLKQQKNNMILDKYLEEGQLIVVFSLFPAELSNKLQAIKTKFNDANYQIYIGETVTEWEKLYVAYQKISRTKTLEEFYPELKVERHLNQLNTFTSVADLDYVGFNNALGIGDFQTIKMEIEMIFNNLTQNKVEPERAKSVGLLLFTDIYRMYPTISEERYHQEVTNIRNSQTIDAIQQILFNALHISKETKTITHYSTLVREAISNIRDHYSQELTLKSIAKDLHVNPVYFGQLFKKETQLGVNQYINQFRIKKAQKLLTQTNLGIAEIAETVGYNNTNYFSKMFKKLNGLSPKEFREQYFSNYDAIDQTED